MQYIRELAEYNGNGRAAVTFGKFDGLHRGHQMLVTKVHELGKQENINSIVCSFDMRPLWKEKGIAPEHILSLSPLGFEFYMASAELTADEIREAMKEK